MAESTQQTPADETPDTGGTAPKGTAARQRAQRKGGEKLEKERQQRIADRDADQDADGKKVEKGNRQTAKAITKAQQNQIDLFQKALTDPETPLHTEVTALLDDLIAERLDGTPAAAPEDIPAPTNIYEALWAVMRDVRSVGKNGRNEDQGYSFRGIDDVMNALGPAMRRHGVLMFPKLERKNVERWVRQTDQRGNQKFSTAVQVEVRYRFLFAPGGKDDYVDVLLPGESIDTSDKAMAKAMSVALRTAMLQTFALPTYDEDPDQRNQELETPKPITVDEVQAAAQWAAGQMDLDRAFYEVRQAFEGRPMDGVVLPTKESGDLDPDQYLTYVQERVSAQRAEAERAQQDQDADGEARAPEQGDAHGERAQEQTRAQDAPAEGAQGRELTVEEATAKMRATKDAQQDEPARENSARPETRAEKMLRLIQDEAAFQAEVLGVNLTEYVHPILETSGDLDTLIAAKAPRFLVAQRPAVVKALRAKGEATQADNLERIGQGFPLTMENIYGGDASDREHARTQ